MEYEKIEFSKNWNNKLLCDVFTTIRPAYKSYNTGEAFDIRIGTTHFCYARVLKSENKTLRDIISAGIHLFDTRLNEKEFLALMSTMYSKKPWWKNEDTEMKVIFLQKVQQLTIFDDGRFPA